MTVDNSYDKLDEDYGRLIESKISDAIFEQRINIEKWAKRANIILLNKTWEDDFKKHCCKDDRHVPPWCHDTLKVAKDLIVGYYLGLPVVVVESMANDETMVEVR